VLSLKSGHVGRICRNLRGDEMKIGDARVGRGVISNREFAGVPKGSLGKIVEDYGTGVTVEWEDIDGGMGRKLRDGFSKDFDLQFLDAR